MTRAYWSPKKRLPPFFEVPEARGCHTVGRSVIRQPRLDGGDHHLGRLVLVLDQVRGDVLQQLDPEGPVAVGRVGELLAR